MTWQGCESLGQAVDHRHGGVLGELEHHRVVEDADHDRVDVARQHPRRVGDGLAAAELHLLAGEHDGLAAELAHRRRRRRRACGSRACRRSSPAPCRRAAASLRHLALAAVRLEGGARLEDAAQLGAGEVLEIEEMRVGRRSFGGSAPGERPHLAPRAPRRRASSRATASPISASPTISGGSSRTTLSPAVIVSSFSPRAASTKSVFGDVRAQPEHQALAADLGDDRRDGGPSAPARRCFKQQAHLR